MSDDQPISTGLGRTGTAVVVVTTVLVLVAPIVSLGFAGSRAGDPIDWGAFFRTGFLTWLAISLVTSVSVTVWLWLGWESPDTDSMEHDKETE